MAMIYQHGRMQILSDRQIRERVARARASVQQGADDFAARKRWPVSGEPEDRIAFARAGVGESLTAMADAMLPRAECRTAAPESDALLARSWGPVLAVAAWALANGVLAAVLVLLALKVTLGILALALWGTTLMLAWERLAPRWRTGSGPGGPEGQG